MQVCCYLLLLLHITEGCRLKGNGETEEITAYTGVSVLLPCSCIDLHSKPETFTWMKTKNEYNWVQISPESDQYKERFQLVNDHSSGNLSLLISHLTEEDGGRYRCSVEGAEYRYIRLTVKGCTLNQQTVDVTGNVGQSVLLPCSCSELQAKPHTWRFLKEFYTEIFPKDQTNRYTGRVQLFIDHPPGNLSLLISHLTVEDGGWYRCEISNEISKDIRLTVKDIITTKPTLEARDKKIGDEILKEDSIENPTANHQIIIISSSVAGVLLLLLILGGFIYWKHRGQKRGQTQSSDGQTGQKTQQEKQELNEPLNLTVTSEPTYEAVDKQNDSSVLYAVINPQTKLKKAEVKDDVTYSSVVHSNTVRAAHTPVESGDTTVYASIKTN
ncbi:cell adhesion molecule DSCAM-like isoform X2 [Hemibagrus wyckioides]|uniref:cell adhesion molecule DSCAM-like isoform X2 n=1 Tax=Hemibagrus wyckioides TaxID=337641 RepID=UPI00266CAE79|nr:cell adhesion molecule DSCAM-like isoform X2 [Hemibagrus wyckioides]